MDEGPATPGPSHCRTSTWSSGSAEDTSTVVSRMRLHAVSASAQRHAESAWTGEGTEAPPSRCPPAAPECDLQRMNPGESCDKDDVDDALGARQRPQSSLIHFRCRNENRDKADPCHQKESEEQRLNPVDHDGASLRAGGLHVAIVGVQRHRVRAHSPPSVECLGLGQLLGFAAARPAQRNDARATR